MSGKAGPIATVAILAAGAGALILGGGEEINGGDGGVLVADEIPVTEEQLAPKAVRSNGGKLVRIVGAAAGDSEKVKDTALGRVVEVTTIPDNVLCHAIVDARPKAKSEFYPDGNEFVGNVPDVPELKDCYGKASWPVMIPGSCLPGPVGSCMWSMLLKGECCKIVGDLPQYEGSTLKEILARPIEVQKRIIRTKGRCIGDEGQEISCTVSIGDAKAIAGAEVFIPHGWAGRSDLNFVFGEWNEQNKEHKPKPRYEMPEGVGGPP